MSWKFTSLIAAAMFVALLCGCHTVSTCGTRYHDTGAPCQKDACQKDVCQKGICQKSGGCDGGYRGHHLLDALHGHFWGGPGCGCGERYWNEWQYDPPDCCDPCDDCYGQYVGPRDDCKHKWIIDPTLWIAALGHKHCRPAGCYDPCGNWHCCGDEGCGCGKGCCGGGEVYGDEYLEGPSAHDFAPGEVIDGIPDPQPVSAGRPNRVASHDELRR